ncbi:MAG TPA: tail fiber domain-containing protein [Candidatus Nanoarchaeia archaeon]|nr:tail fiber domain-containing protein [Candidatus Nanoarchaeia archaeon]
MEKDTFPKLKKNLSSFLKEEGGTISKQSIISIGAFVGAVVASGLFSTKDAEAGAITLTSSEDGVNAQVTASHSHHASHSSHSSHGSHSSHSSSDMRLKEDIRGLSGSLEKIGKVQGVSFNWAKTGESDIGLIAQNVEMVFPELVLTDKKTGLKSIKYANLVAPLIEAIKEQQAQIEELRGQVEELKREKEERLLH